MKPIVLFDGVCNFCNGAVNFLIDRDPAGNLAFAPLQSPKGQEILAAHGLPATGQEALDTMILVEDDRVSTRTTAALRTLPYLKQPWPLLRVLLAVPRPLRDLAYRAFARNRYRLFGKRETCRVPTPEIRARFLDAPA
ncbi:MAG: thiol-disulfide oxidoreductase DCC family protein [Acidobacteriota bacterium]